MKYLVFVGSRRYPRGGARDLVGTYRSLDKAMEVAKETAERSFASGVDCWGHVLNTESNEILFNIELNRS